MRQTASLILILLFSATLWPQSRATNEGKASAQLHVDLTPGEADSRVIHRVTPEYPSKARQGGIEGPVTLRIVVASDGSVEKMTPLRGNPFLLMAAMNAVKQWRYRPYLLNGTAVEFVSDVTVNFTL